MKLGKKLRAVTAGLLTAALSVGMGAFPGTALETGTGEIAGLQAFLLGNSETGGADYNGDGVVDGMDLTLLRQKAGASGEIQDGYTGFIHADGKQLVDEDGKPYTIKGMAFGNEVWSNPSAEPTRHHDAESYQELAEMGFDSVRFYLNYGLFESDSNPYTYREEGFAWLDKNIAWAKAAGIRLVLNMHYPQGGYQSQGDGTALWTEPENQKRLCALWTEIARRYADEPVILGYGLVNEPVVAAASGEKSLELWQSVAQTLTDGIRTVDNNHMIFVERMCASQDLAGTQEQWVNFNDENNYVRLDDDNTVYEFHYYDPHAFTHQGFDWAGTLGNDVTYPDESYLVSGGNTQWSTSTFAGDKADTSDTEWQYLKSGKITPKADGTQVISLVFQAENVGSYGYARADELRLDEYDEDSNWVQTIYAEDCDDTTALNFWSSDKSGGLYYTSGEGHLKKGCLMITGTTDDANGGTRYFCPTPGHSYEASGYFQVNTKNAGAIVRPRVDVWDVDSIDVLNRAYLEKTIAQNIAFSDKYNVPVYCGEFGAGIHCFENDRGGDRWLDDVMDIFHQNNISFNYHSFNEYSFGLHNGSSLPTAENRNDTLYQVLVDKLKKYAE